MCVRKGSAVSLNLGSVTDTDPLAIALLSRPSWQALHFVHFLLPSSLSASLDPVLMSLCIADSGQGISDSANGGLTCLWGWIPFLWFFIFWVCLSLSIQVKTDIRTRKWPLRVSLQGHENSVASTCRSLNKSNEFPGKVGGSQTHTALPQCVRPLVKQWESFLSL